MLVAGIRTDLKIGDVITLDREAKTISISRSGLAINYYLDRDTLAYLTENDQVFRIHASVLAGFNFLRIMSIPTTDDARFLSYRFT